MAKVAEKESKYNVTYEEKVITSEIQYENPISDISKIPVFSLENVEVQFCSLTQKTPKIGHSITFLVDENFIQQDRQLRGALAQLRQKSDPNCETYNSQIKIITQKDILENKWSENMIGKGVLSIYTTNAKMFDADEERGKALQKMSDAQNGNIVYKYFANIDKYTGEAIQPSIYKIENGEKITTFVSKKDNEEKPLYVNSKDLVNIKIRPYETYSDQYKYSCKYNLLEVEIVQSAFDRGLSQYKGGGSRKTEEAPNTVDLSSLGDIFGNIGKKAETKQPKTTVESTTGVPGKEPEVKQVEVKTVEEQKSESFDFSNMFQGLPDLGTNNLGE